jgi:hypothetical protein
MDLSKRRARLKALINPAIGARLKQAAEKLNAEGTGEINLPS